MHAREDNPEMLKAKGLNIPIYSYPEYIYEQSKNKKRVVIGGSHGKTSITAMILHVLQNLNINCDFMVGAQLEGFDAMVKLANDSKLRKKFGKYSFEKSKEFDVKKINKETMELYN